MQFNVIFFLFPLCFLIIVFQQLNAQELHAWIGRDDIVSHLLGV